jgi:hypothetical protein
MGEPYSNSRQLMWCVAWTNGEINMKTLSLKMNYVALVMVLLSIALWIGGLFFGYLSDEWMSPPANERSFPGPKTY